MSCAIETRYTRYSKANATVTPAIYYTSPLLLSASDKAMTRQMMNAKRSTDEEPEAMKDPYGVKQYSADLGDCGEVRGKETQAGKGGT